MEVSVRAVDGEDAYEAVVLRFSADVSGKQAAAAMGVSAGSVKAHTSRGLTALHNLLGELA